MDKYINQMAVKQEVNRDKIFINIENNIDRILNEKDRPMAWLIRLIGGSRTGFKQTLSRNTIDIRKLLEVSKHLGVSIYELMKDEESGTFPISAIIENPIPIVPEKARAGFLMDAVDKEYMKQLPKVSIPWLKGKECFGFEINGDSMEPEYTTGDIIIGSKVLTSNDIKNEKLHVVHTAEGLQFKKIILNKKMLELHSLNNKYPVQKIEYSTVKSLWYREACISSNFNE